LVFERACHRLLRVRRQVTCTYLADHVLPLPTCAAPLGSWCSRSALISAAAARCVVRGAWCVCIVRVCRVGVQWQWVCGAGGRGWRGWGGGRWGCVVVCGVMQAGCCCYGGQRRNKKATTTATGDSISELRRSGMQVLGAGGLLMHYTNAHAGSAPPISHHPWPVGP
jgi:hypothetical protein